MKIRSGFVSNSSSSSFICDVCGEDASGWDMGLEDAEMFECEKGHYVCDSHRLEVDKEELRKFAIGVLEEELEKWEKEEVNEYWVDRAPKIAENTKVILEQIKTMEITDDDIPALCSREQLSEIREDTTYDELINKKHYGGYPRYGVTNLMCPLCQFKEYSDSDALQALKKKYDLDKDKIIEIIKEQGVLS